VPPTRVLRRIDDLLIRLEPIVVRCIRALVNACIEGYAAAGFALYGYPPNLHRSREVSLEYQENGTLQKRTAARDQIPAERGRGVIMKRGNTNSPDPAAPRIKSSAGRRSRRYE
jgi:hypothetical protein